MKKKFYSIFALILSIVLSLSLLTACGGKDDSGDQSDAGDTGDALTMEIAGDAWEVDGIVYHFFEDGIGSTDNGYIFYYTWDGSSGVVTAEDESVSLEIIYDEDGFFMEGEDEQFYELTYAGEADLNLLVENGYYDDDDDDDGGEELAGAYDNDDEEMSIVFYSDGTVVMSDFEFSDEGTYTVDGDYILMEFEGQFPYEAYYDSSDDSFQVDGLDGWFYYVDEAWYTP